MNLKEAIETILYALSELPFMRDEDYDALDYIETNMDNFVEVVRCKDCKHYMLWEDSDDKKTCAKAIGLMVSSPDDFCSYGERRK